MTEQQELEALNDLFSQDGWKILMSDLQKIYDTANDLAMVQDEKDFLSQKGFLEGLNTVLNYQTVIEAASESN